MFLDPTKLFYSQVQNLEHLQKLRAHHSHTFAHSRALTNASPKILEQYQKIPKSVVMHHIGKAAGKFFGVGRIFARILPNLPEKNSIKSDLQKESSSCNFGRHSCPYFQEFSQIFRDFLKVFGDFAQISTDFHQIKTFRGALTPPAPASQTSGAT